MGMLIETLSTSFRKARTTNATNTSFPSKVPTGTEPTGTGSSGTAASVIDCGWGGVVSQNGLLVMPYGTGDNDDVFALRVIGWTVVGNDSSTWVWVPMILAEITCTMSSTIPGVSGRDVVATEYFCDTLSMVTGNEDVSVDITSPTGDVGAHFVVDLKGCQKVELTFDTTTGDPTGANALIRFV
jgi:hypothetical protein